MKHCLSFILGLIFSLSAYADVVFRAGADIAVSVAEGEAAVVYTALELFGQDYKSVFNGKVSQGANAAIHVQTLDSVESPKTLFDPSIIATLRQHRNAYLLAVKGDQLYIWGSDAQGTAYGILELSRMIGVSPWVWWADAPVMKKDSYRLKKGLQRLEYPSVAYRGIFLNDEDWGLRPWAAHTFDSATSNIGPKTYAKIFELLLRLRANLIWPAMHEGTQAFFSFPGNLEMAAQYGIQVGSSHAEPMLRNNVDEWKEATMGAFNYLTNAQTINDYWARRVQQSRSVHAVYTLGIRGVHDSKMLGAKTPQEQRRLLEQVMRAQRILLSRYIHSEVEKVPQVFIPYKEVMDAYYAGLEVPEDVTLIWCDDNYGYIRHFPNETERARKGGNGVYYHISYWGRPHDYLWLATQHPALVYTQMKRAYEKGAQTLWVVNVGDLKPGEYLIELFLDMAWNINGIKDNAEGLRQHLRHWLAREFGAGLAGRLLPVMNEYYRLAYIRKPAFMGGTRTEEKDPGYKVVVDLPWSEAEIRQRISDYEYLGDQVSEIARAIPKQKRSIWFQLIEYPVRGAVEMNKKLLYGQLARHGKADWQLSDTAYDSIELLTQQYNALSEGKWKGIMDFQPRRLAVFDKLPRVKANAPLIEKATPLFRFNGADYKKRKGALPAAHGLGYQNAAVQIKKGGALGYSFRHQDLDSVKIQLRLLPHHPVGDDASIRYAVWVDEGPQQVVDFATKGRSETWKENVLRNQALGETWHDISGNQTHKVWIKALDEGVTVDQILIW